jgi:hypothetical protein
MNAESGAGDSSKKPKTTMTISISEELKQQLLEEAAQDGRSVSNYVAQKLERRHLLAPPPSPVKPAPKSTSNGAKRKKP